MFPKDLEKNICDIICNLTPSSSMPENSVLNESVYFDRSQKSNEAWTKLIYPYLAIAKQFEIHCWNEESEWIDLALQYGDKKESDWKYGHVIVGEITPKFIEMILSLPKPVDTEIYNKMTPFFNIFLDDKFQSCHYGTENYFTK